MELTKEGAGIYGVYMLQDPMHTLQEFIPWYVIAAMPATILLYIHVL